MRPQSERTPSKHFTLLRHNSIIKPKRGYEKTGSTKNGIVHPSNRFYEIMSQTHYITEKVKSKHSF